MTLFSFSSPRIAHHDVRIPHGAPCDGSVVVRLSAQSGQGGIYYLPEKTTLSALLNIAGVKHQAQFDQNMLTRPLITGDAVVVETDKTLTFDQMNAEERIALGLAIDLNRATVDELMLVAGIGEATALKIVHFREMSGPFKKVSDLMKISGIKEKKFRRWERFFYLPR
jgi:competence protein ComEA